MKSSLEALARKSREGDKNVKSGNALGSGLSITVLIVNILNLINYRPFGE